MSDKIGFQTKAITKHKERGSIKIKGLTQEETVTLIAIYNTQDWETAIQAHQKEKQRTKKKYTVNWKTRFKMAINTYLSFILINMCFVYLAAHEY